MTKEHDMIVILLTEDSDDDARIIKYQSKEFADITWVKTLSEAKKSISEKSYDVILLDLSLPDARGIEAITTLREMTYIPLIVVTGLDENHPTIFRECILAGADSVIFKDSLTSTELYRRIEIAICHRKYFTDKILNKVYTESDKNDLIDKCFKNIEIDTNRIINKLDALNNKMLSLQGIK